MSMETVEFKFPDEDSDVMQGVDDKETSGPVESDEIEVEVLDDTPEGDKPFENAKPVVVPTDEVTEEDLKNYSEKSKTKIKKRLELFTRGYHDERRAKEAAEREREEAIRVAQTLLGENNKLKERVNQNQAVLSEQAKKVAVNEVEQARAAFKAAYEAGDSDALADAQEKLTAAKIRSDRLANLRLPPLQPAQAPVLSQQIRQAPEQDTRAVEWQKSNQWFNGSSVQEKYMTKVALAVHTALVDDESVDPRSDAYYDALNSRMRQIFPDKFPDTASDDRPKAKPNVVASASRSVAPRKITLTKTQVALAKRLGVPIEAYAKQVAEEMRKNHG